MGYLIFDLAVLDFYLANAGSATGAFRDAAMQGPLILGNIALAALLTLGVLSRPAASGVLGGLVIAWVLTKTPAPAG